MQNHSLFRGNSPRTLNFEFKGLVTCDKCSYTQYVRPSLVSCAADSMLLSDTLCPVVTLAVDLQKHIAVMASAVGSPFTSLIQSALEGYRYCVRHLSVKACQRTVHAC